MKPSFLLLAFCSFLAACNLSKDKNSIVVGLQPYENFEQQWIDTISKTISEVYGFKVVQLPKKDLPQQAFTSKNGGRYRADSLIKIQRTLQPDTIDYILGLTKKDISTTKRDANGQILQPENKYIDWGILGLGYRPGTSCILSTYRIHHPDKKIFLDRFKKIAMHELGHNLNLPHCPSEDCVMKDAAETIKTVDQV